MRPIAFAALGVALVAAAALAMQFGPACKSSRDCAKSQECVAHEDKVRDVVRRTCEYPCSVEVTAASKDACPKDRVCMHLGSGPQSSLGGVCVRVR